MAKHAIFSSLFFRAITFVILHQGGHKWRKMSEHHGDFTALYQAKQLLEIFESMDTPNLDIKLNKIEIQPLTGNALWETPCK